MPDETKRTHVKDLKNPKKVLLPSRDLVSITLGEDESHHGIPFTLLDDLLLNLRHGSAVETYR